MKAAPPKSPQRGLWKSEASVRLLTALIGIALATGVGYLALLRLGGALVLLSYDVPFLVHRAGGAEDIRLVYLDQLDGDILNRRVQAELLDALGAAGAKAVVYDLIFDKPSSDPAIDEAFSAAIRRFRGVDLSGQSVPGAQRRFVLLACGRRLFSQAGAAGEELITPTNQLLDAADDFGLVLFMHDEAFTVRELNTGSPDEPSLMWKTATLLGATLNEAARMEPRWINYAGPPRNPVMPTASPAVTSCRAADVLAGTDSAFLRGKIVVIGGEPGIVGAAAGQDLFSTPFHRFDNRGNLALMSGVELQANALNNLLRGNWLNRTGRLFDLGFIGIAGTVAGAVFSRLRPLRGLALAVALALILASAGILSVHWGQIWFPWTVPALLQIPVALVWGMAAHFYVERFFRVRLSQEQRVLREAFSKYLSPQMLDRLTREGFSMRLGGEKVRAAMIFTDIEGFTDMCQKIRDPQHIVETLNDYFERTTGHIFDHDGVVIKFIGDAIFAAWGTPVADPEAPVKAVRAAWKLFISARLIVDGEELKTRIGLHCGDIVAGNIGSHRHVDYTLIGDDVNLAARLEGLNKILGTSILLSEEIRSSLGTEFITRRVGRFQVKGRQDITVVHELIGPSSQEPPPAWIERYHQAVSILEAGDVVAATSVFTEVNAARTLRGDGPSRFFLQLLATNNVLPAGVVTMTEK